MADQRARAAGAADPAENKTEEPPEVVEEPTYSQERLIAEAGDFIGQPSYVVAGALDSIKKKNLTLAETKAAVAAFLDRKVS